MQLTMVMMSRVCHFKQTAQSKLDVTFIEEIGDTEDTNDSSNKMDMSTQVYEF
jgi:hypothetical protein